MGQIKMPPQTNNPREKWKAELVEKAEQCPLLKNLLEGYRASSKWQVVVCYAEYKKNPTPTGSQYKDFALKLYLPIETVKGWNKAISEKLKNDEEKANFDSMRFENLPLDGPKDEMLEKEWIEENKMTRSCFTEKDLTFLREKFKTCPLPTDRQLEEMRKSVKVSEKQLREWFKNQRKWYINYDKKQARPQICSSETNNPREKWKADLVEKAEKCPLLKNILKNHPASTKWQVVVCYAEFKNNKNPTPSQYKEFALKHYLPISTVKQWNETIRSKLNTDNKTKSKVNAIKFENLPLDGPKDDKLEHEWIENNKNTICTFTDDEKKFLMEEFEKYSLPTEQQLGEYRKRVKVSEKQIKEWFHRERQRNEKYQEEKQRAPDPSIPNNLEKEKSSCHSPSAPSAVPTSITNAPSSSSNMNSHR